MKTRHDPATKPYYRCLSCQQFRHRCAGLPTRDMSLEEWCEYMRDIKELAHLSNAYISKEADVSIKTIERIMGINCEQDIMRSTARRIELAVIGSVGKHFCDLDYDSAAAERIAGLLTEVEYWKKENDRKAKIIDKYID